MPFTATSASFGCPPRDPIDLNERYVVQVASLTERQMPKFGSIPGPDGNTKPEDMEDKVIWAFSCFRMDGTPVINAEGGIYTLDAITKTSVSPSRPGKPVSKARTYAEQILGRDPKAAIDNGEDLMAILLGRFAYALLEEKTRLDGGKSIVLLRLTTIVDQSKVAAAVAAGIAAASLKEPANAAPHSLPW